jgi:hypothetical protein
LYVDMFFYHKFMEKGKGCCIHITALLTSFTD